jgi:hypothetical protein
MDMSETPVTYGGLPAGARAVVAAFADGEPVDPDALDRALADADGRAWLIDLLTLRGLVAGRGPDRGQPDRGQVLLSDVLPVRRIAAPASPPSSRSARSSRGRWWSLAATIAVASALGGYTAGQWMPGGDRAGETLAVGGGGLAAPAGSTSTPLDAPDPTLVIRFEPGLDWQEHAGPPGRTGGER